MLTAISGSSHKGDVCSGLRINSFLHREELKRLLNKLGDVKKAYKNVLYDFSAAKRCWIENHSGNANKRH